MTAAGRSAPPVFTKSYDLVLEVWRFTEQFPKSQRFVLGQRTQAAALELVEAVVAALSSGTNAPDIVAASKAVERLRILFRLAKDQRMISLRRYEIVSEQTDELGRMIGAWLKKKGGRSD